jgi:hypothetical protein
MDEGRICAGNAWRDLVTVVFYFVRLILAMAMPIVSALACAVLLFMVRTTQIKMIFAAVGIFWVWRLLRKVRLAQEFCKAHPHSTCESEPFASIPLSELGIYANCAYIRQPRGWWLENASLVRSPVLILEHKNQPKPLTALKIGLPILAGLSDDQARCLLTYKVTRLIRRANRIDRVLERLNQIAAARVKPQGRNPGERINGAFFWSPVYRYTLQAVARNEQYARDWTARECGEHLRDQTFDRIREIQKAWPVFESSVLAPLLNMGGIPPVAESFRIWLAAAGSTAEAFPGEKSASNPNAAMREQTLARLLEHERILYTKIMGERELRPIKREGAYARLGPIFWEEQSRVLRQAIPGKKLRDLPDLLADLPSLYALTLSSSDSELPELKKKQMAADQLHFACLTYLSKAGWTWQVPPIRPIILTQSGIQICPQIWFQKLLEGSLSRAEFEDLLEEQMLCEVPLTHLPAPKPFVM